MIYREEHSKKQGRVCKEITERSIKEPVNKAIAKCPVIGELIAPDNHKKIIESATESNRRHRLQTE